MASATYFDMLVEFMYNFCKFRYSMIDSKYLFASSRTPTQYDSLRIYKFYEPKQTDNMFRPFDVMSVFLSYRFINFFIDFE